MRVSSTTTFAAIIISCSFLGVQAFGILPPVPPVAVAPPSTRSTKLAVVADAETEDLKQSNRRDEGDNGTAGAWTKTKDGNYLPNLGLNRIQFFGQPQQQPSIITTGSRRNQIIEIQGLQDYKRHVVDETEQMVCVRFYAPWCRACKAIGPAFHKLPEQYPTIKFVDVPVTDSNKFLHQGLGIPSLPYGHLYHPEVGLVEERKIGRQNFKMFRDEILRSYVDGFCELPADDEDDSGLQESDEEDSN